MSKRKFGNKSKQRLKQMLLSILIGFALAGGYLTWAYHHSPAAHVEDGNTPLIPAGTKIGGPFTLTDQNGKIVTDKDFTGKYLMIYFGYTSCPDMCPTGLVSMSHALETLKGDADKVQPLFVTVDPLRDTPQKLREYDASFNPQILGLTGTDAQIAAIAKEYQVYYQKGEGDDDYVIDHSSLIYLLAPDGKLIGTYPEEVDPQQLVDGLKKAWNPGS